MEKKQISDGAKQQAVGLIQQANIAASLRDRFIDGLASGLGLKGKWNFSFDELCFTKQEEQEPCLDTEKLLNMEASPTSKI